MFGYVLAVTPVWITGIMWIGLAASHRSGDLEKRLLLLSGGKVRFIVKTQISAQCGMLDVLRVCLIY